MISLITVVRNNASRIDATIQSVLLQKGEDVEYLVIDGASTDGTQELIRGYGNAIDQFISEPDTGIYNALNKGIARARGSIIGIVHSGDLLVPGIVERVIEEHERNPESILYGCIKAMERGRFNSVWGWSHEFLPEKMLPHPACFVPTVVYRSFGGYDESFRVAGDYEAFMRYYSEKVPFRFIDAIVQEFDLHGISQTSVFESELARIRQRYPACIRQNDLEHILRNRIGGLARRMLKGIEIAFGGRRRNSIGTH